MARDLPRQEMQEQMVEEVLELEAVAVDQQVQAEQVQVVKGTSGAADLVEPTQ